MYPVSFLGREAFFPAAPFEIAIRLNCPVFVFFCFKERFAADAPLKLLIREISTDGIDAHQALVKYVRELEAVVRVYPYCWFNFFDFWNSARGAK
jgi:predicted LPLAT superfamily acyltransferase